MKELIVKNDLMHHLNNVVDQSLPKGEITLEQAKYILSLLSNKESEEDKECKHKNTVWIKSIAETYCRNCRNII